MLSANQKRTSTEYRGRGRVLTPMELPTYGNARETYSALLETVELAAVAVCQLLQRPDGSRCMPYASEAARFLFGVTVTDADEAGAQALAQPAPRGRCYRQSGT